MEHRHPKRKKCNIKIKVITFIINFGGNKTVKNRKMLIQKRGPRCLKYQLYSIAAQVVDHSFEISLVVRKSVFGVSDQV